MRKWWVQIESDGVVAVVLVFEENVLLLISVYVPLIGRRLEGRQSFYDEMKNEWDIYIV